MGHAAWGEGGGQVLRNRDRAACSAVGTVLRGPTTIAGRAERAGFVAHGCAMPHLQARAASNHSAVDRRCARNCRQRLVAKVRIGDTRSIALIQHEYIKVMKPKADLGQNPFMKNLIDNGAVDVLVCCAGSTKTT